MTLIDQEYKDKLIKAIKKYEEKRGTKLVDQRKGDCLNLRMMIENEEYDGAKFRTVTALSGAIEAYLAEMVTGFDLLKISKMHVATGHSVLRKTVKYAMAVESSDAVRREAKRNAELYEDLQHVSDLHEELKQLRNSYHHERERADMAERNSRRLERQVRRVIKENTALKEALESSETKVNVLNAVCADLQRESESAKEAQLELQSKNANLEQQLDKISRQQQQFKFENTDLKDRMSRMESMLERLSQSEKPKANKPADEFKDSWFEPV
ncbi:MAG: hypothetical protein KAS93_04635 [Gammaproteobacteria bacterium]|nr:hypothetical protein [Gammaproteobacteria bacterium]